MASDSFLSSRPAWQQALAGLGILILIVLAPVALSWYLHPVPAAVSATSLVHVKILAINDFHGQLPPGQNLNKEPAGSVPVLTSYLRTTMAESKPAATFIALPGDIVGASPPESGLLLDEPTLLFFNGFANGCCGQDTRACSASCNMVATLGNHEFDKGTDELLRKINGGNGTTEITHLVDPYPGERAVYVSANVVWTTNHTPIVAPYVIREAGGVNVAFIGADTIKTPSLVIPANTAGITFLNETESINRYVPEIQKKGVHAIIILLHEGGTQDTFEGPTQPGGNVTGRVKDIVAGLDPDIDVVLSGHTHAFTNAYLNNAGSRPVLVTQAYSYSEAFADIDLEINPVTGEITRKSAQIIPAYADRPPGNSPDPAATAFLAKDEEVVAPLTDRIIAITATDITRNETEDGESALGDLVADSQRAAMQADIAFVTTGSLRSDIMQGNVTWGNLYAVQPFSDTVLAMTLSGEQVRSVLEQQWQSPSPPHNLAVSGLSYTFNESRPARSKVLDIQVNGVPLDARARYKAAMGDYLASGGDGYTVFTNGTDTISGPVDVDALVTWIGSLPQPVNVTVEKRIIRIH